MNHDLADKNSGPILEQASWLKHFNYFHFIYMMLMLHSILTTFFSYCGNVIMDKSGNIDNGH